MKTKGRKILYAFIAVIFIVMAVSSLCACDDDGQNKNAKSLTFLEGTTVDDIIRMIDNETIKSYTNDIYVKVSNDFVLVKKGSISDNIAVSYTFDESSGNLMQEYTTYTVFSPEEGKVYIIGNLQASSLEKGYYWENSDKKPVDELKEWLLIRDNIDARISIDKDTITIYVDALFTKIVISDFNNTTVRLPNEYSNYKALAVEIPKDL